MIIKYPLHNACKKSDIKKVKKILIKDISLINTNDYEHNTSLKICCTYGYLDILKFLVKNVTNYNEYYYYDEEYYPIHIAC